MELRVELFARIRRDVRANGSSIRALSKEYRVSRRTVRQALAAAEPPIRKVPVRAAPKLDRFRIVIDEMLIADLDAPRKQRHTAQRIFDRLVDEHQAVISYSTVRQYVKTRRAEVAFEAGRAPVEVFIPQEHAPGAEAEVDFGDVWVDLAGVRTRCYMFAFRLSNSGKSVHRIYPTCAQEAFLEGHIEAFQALGGVPTKHIRYDNLTSAVTKVIYGAGRHRIENERWVLFKSHYGLDAFYCEPGIKGAHEKGGVEGEVGRFRRNEYLRLCAPPNRSVQHHSSCERAPVVVWLGTTDALRHGLHVSQGGVLPHVVGAGLDPDCVVDDPVHDGVRVNTGAEALVPVLLRILGAEHC